jgi:hypothetical protein
VMCQATKQPEKLSKLASHHSDHRWMKLPSNWVESLYKKHLNAYTGIAYGAREHRPKRARIGQISHAWVRNQINVSRFGMSLQAEENGSHKYDKKETGQHHFDL